MNRPEYSLSLDSVICRRCNFVSPAEEDTCPSCGADRQGAIFTSVADTAPAAPVPAPLDILDWDDSHWLQRLVRRRMLTSYPNFIEPGDMPDGQPRKPARTGLVVLIGGVVASIAAGGYFYTHLDENSAPSNVEPGISVAGSIGDGASGVSAADNARHASLARPRADAATTTTHAALPASSTVAQVSRTREQPDAIAARPAPVTVHAAPPVVVASAPAPVKPAAPAAPVVVASAKAPSHDIAPSTTTIVATKPAIAATAAAPSVKPVAPVIASAQKSETHAEASVPVKAAPQAPVIASPQKPEARVEVSLPVKPATPATVIASAQTATTRDNATSTAAIKPKPTIASLDKPATPAPAPIAEPPPAFVAHSIASVQQALAIRDLTSARRHMRGLYASLPRSPEIQQLAADLSRQERARDSAIANARSCAADKDAACALRHARRAVSLDPRNGQAQATLRRALAVQNETNTEYFREASAIPKPIVPAMTFDGRWSAGARHGAASADDSPNFTLFGLGVPAVAKGRGDAH